MVSPILAEAVISTLPGRVKKRANLSLHPGQMLVYQSKARFKVVVAGRRWGKTACARTLIIQMAKVKKRKIWYVAPTYRMAKQIMWQDLLDAIPRSWIRKVNETTLSITLVNKTVIELKGADKADSLRGVGIHYLVLDEFQDMSEETWTQVLRPTLADTGGHALFLGCVKKDTRVLTQIGTRIINTFSMGEGPKELSEINLDLYGLDREFHNANGFWNNGFVKTKKIKTLKGFELESSLPHPIWVLDETGNEGWKNTRDIEVGDRVAIARGMEVWGNIDPLSDWQEHVDDWHLQKSKKQGMTPKRMARNEQ